MINAKSWPLLVLLLLLGCTIAEPTPMPTQNPAPTIVPTPAPLLEDVSELSWEYATVELGETSLVYATLLPPDFDPANEYPLLLALPPGPQDRGMVEAGLSNFWQRGALYGFVIVSPVKPLGTNYMNAGSLVLPDFVAFLQETYNIAGGKPHLGGISNGGISTFRAGLERPNLYQSLTVMPGYAAENADIGKLSGLKVSLFVGEDDGAWVTNSQSTYDRLLASGHEDALLDIVVGEGHIITPLTGNGIGRIFERLLE